MSTDNSKEQPMKKFTDETYIQIAHLAFIYNPMLYDSHDEYLADALQEGKGIVDAIKSKKSLTLSFESIVNISNYLKANNLNVYNHEPN